MQLQPEDLEELADFFAKRFPSTSDREALVRSTGLDTVLPSEPLPAWLVLLATAQQKDRMGVLIQAAAGLRPDDDSLSDVAAAFSEQKKLPIGKALISLAVLFALGVRDFWPLATFVTAAFAGALGAVIAATLTNDPLVILGTCAALTWALRVGSLTLGWRLPVYRARPPRQ